MYSCHSVTSPLRLTHKVVYHSQSKKVFWNFVFSDSCQYDKKLNDKQCNGCKECPKQ